MVTQFGIKLAVYLVSSYFGDIIAKVCECLLRKGTLTYANIVMYTELNRETVRNSLLLLIQRNCVQAFAVEQEDAFGEAPKVVTQYMVLFNNIIHHMRFPKFLVMVSEELGKECEDILLALLEHGRLSMTQIVDRHNDKPNRSEEVTDEDALERNFNRLVEARYIERCPFHEPRVAPPSEEEIAAAKKRGAKAAKIMEVAKTLEQRALEAAAPMDSLRFLVETFNESNDYGEDNKERPSSMTPVEKARMDLASGSGTKKEVLWRANYEEFVRRLRSKACVANVRTRLDDSAAVVLNAILQATRSAGTEVKMESSVPLSMNAIFDEVIKSEHGLAMTLDHVRAALVQLGCELPEDIDETYSVVEILIHVGDLKSIVELAQTEEVESIVLKRYGKDAYRIFRLLAKAGYQLETDKISDSTFVEKKDSSRILFKLWKEDYLHMEKLEATAGRQITFLLWKVNKPLVWEHVLDEMYHAALNLRIRLAHELAKDKEILQLPRENRVGELKTRYDRMRKVRIALESSLMNLDDSIMLFNDF